MTIETKFNIGDEVYWLRDVWGLGTSKTIEKVKITDLEVTIVRDRTDLWQKVMMGIICETGSKDKINESFCFATPREAFESQLEKERSQLNTAAKNSNERIAKLKKVVDELEKPKL